MKTLALVGALALTATLAVGQAQALTLNFDAPVAIGPTQAPGVWYTDRYAPDSFVSGVSYGGHATTLEVGIAARDFQGAGSFYNTQGRMLDVDPSTTQMSIDLYIDQSFATGPDRRIAGFWGTSFGGPDAPAWPIIELDRIGGALTFRGWDNSGVFFNLGALTGADVGTWQTLRMDIAGPNFTYTAGGVTASTSAFGTGSIGNVILQTHNTGANFTVHWDNLSAVPEPGSWALMLLGFGGIGAALRRRVRSLRLAA
jgi:hypothetical protein